jgi:hypothetical protein
MKAKIQFINQLKRIRKIEFYSRMIKFLFLIVLIVLSAFLSIEKLMQKDIPTGIFLFLSLILFSALAYFYFKDAYEYYSIKNSTVFYCVSKPERVTEIIVYPKSIIFEIKGMKDETILLKDSVRKDEMIQYIIIIFGKDKVVMNS